MNITRKTFIILVFLLCFFSFKASSGYYQLVGKWARINGPQAIPLLGVALNESTYLRLRQAFDSGDVYFFENTLKNYDIFRIKNNSTAMVLDVDLFARKAKVMVFTGLYKQESGWIPLEWLDADQQSPGFASAANGTSVHYPIDPPLKWYRLNRLY